VSKSDVPLREIDTRRVGDDTRTHNFVTEEGIQVNALDTETTTAYDSDLDPQGGGRIDEDTDIPEQEKPDPEIDSVDVFALSWSTPTDSGVVDNPDLSGLSKEQLLSHLTSRKYRSAVNLWYNMKFDASVILANICTERQLTELAVQNETTVRCKNVEYDITRIRGKVWKISDPNNNVYRFYDISQFFYAPLDAAAEEWLGERKVEDVDPSRFDEKDYLRSNYRKIRTYAEKDADLTRRLGKELIEHAERLGVPMSRPISTGYIGEAYLDEKEIKPSFGNSPYQTEFWDSYYGGRFEVFERGNVGEVVAPDINSAYPAVMSELPDPSTVAWEYRSNETDEADTVDPEDLEGADYGVVDVEISTNPNKTIQPFAQKIDGRLTFPVLTNDRITVLKEIFIFALRNGYVKDYEIKEAWLGYETEDTEFPFDFVKDLYADRKEAEYVEGKPKKGELIKIILNSLYGKTCQTTDKTNLEDIGEGLELDEGKEPWKHPKPTEFYTGYVREQLEDEVIVCSQEAGSRFNPFLASYITGLTRLKLHRSVEEAGLVDDTVMFATDCIMVHKEPYQRSDFEEKIQTADPEDFKRSEAKEALGMWDFDYEGSAFVVGSGVYSVEKPDGEVYEKTRGFRQAEIDGSLREEASKYQKGIPIENERPKTINEVLTSVGGGEIGSFESFEKELSPDFDSKRVWESSSPTFTDLLAGSEGSEPLYSKPQQADCYQVDCGSVDVAEAIRSDYSKYVRDEYGKTVYVRKSIPEQDLADVQGRAAQSRLGEVDRAEQTDLTKTEKRKLKDRGSFEASDIRLWNHAKQVKGLALNHGVTAWLDYYDPTITVDSHRSSLRKAGDSTGVDAYEQTEDEVTRKVAKHQKAYERYRNRTEAD
jgi:hypothetical protein